MRKWWNGLRRYLSGRIEGNEEQAPHIPLRKPAPIPRGALPEFEHTVHQAIRWYGRRKVRQEIKMIHRRLISDQPDSLLARQLRRIFPGGKLR